MSTRTETTSTAPQPPTRDRSPDLPLVGLFFVSVIALYAGLGYALYLVVGAIA